MCDSFRVKYIEQSQQFSFAFVLNGLSLVSEAEEKYKSSRNPRLLVELLLMKLGHLQSFIQNIPSLEEVKKKLSNSEPIKPSSFKNAPSIVEEKVKPAPPKIIEKVVVAEKGKLSGFEAFKRQKELQAKNDSEANEDDDADTSAVSQPNGLTQESDSNQLVDTDLGSDSNVAITDSPKPVKVVYQTLDEAYVGFYQTQGPRISTCLKSLSYRLNESQLLIELSTSGQESIIEEIKPQMMQFFKAHLKSISIKNIGWEMGEIQVVERRPYTDKEKLDFLVKKHPALGEALESLHLRLP